MALPGFLSAALKALAAYIDSNRAAFVAEVTPVLGNGIDAIAAAIKKVADSTFFGKLLDGIIAQLDAQAKASVSTDAGALIDLIVTEIEKLANS